VFGFGEREALTTSEHVFLFLLLFFFLKAAVFCG
jgi:hypothetical protein